MKRPSILTLAAIGGVGLAAALPAIPAVSQTSPPTPVVDVEIVGDATLLARGAAVLVPVQVECDDGERFASLQVQVTQAVGRRLAQGFAGQEVDCDGGVQFIEVPLAADTSPFRRGVAFARADLFACYAVECSDDFDVTEIEVRRASRDR